MPLIIVTAVTTLMTLGVMFITGYSFIRSLPLALCSVILTGYVGALTGSLSIGIWIVRIWMVICTLLCAKYVYDVISRKKSLDFSIIFSIALFAFTMCLLWWLCRGRMFFDWDEFSFWGVAAKFTYYKDTLYTSPLFDNGFKSYPPAQIILQYMMLKIPSFPFREDVVILVTAMLPVSLLLYPASVLVEKKKYIGAFAMTVIAFLIPALIVSHPYYAITVDMQIGLLSAFIVLVCCLEGSLKYKIIMSSLAASVLTIYKSSGFGLAIIACISGAFILFISREITSHKGFAKKLCIFIPVIASLITNFSWKAYTRMMGIEERWSAGASNTIFDLLKGNALDYQKDVLSSFTEAFFKTDIYGTVIKFPPVGWAVISVIFVVTAVVLTDRTNRKNIVASYSAALLGYIIFVVSQLYTYLFVFEEIEAVLLASFYRYLTTPILTLMVVSVVILCLSILESNRKTVNCFIVLALASLFVISPQTLEFCQKMATSSTRAAQTKHDRYLYIRTARYINQLGEGENTRLFLVSANDAGRTQMLVEYELEPFINLPAHASIIAANPSPDHPWVQKMSAEEWGALLYNDFDYVYIHCPETQFVADYLHLFEDESMVVVDKMFRVIRKDDGTVSLRQIEMQPEDGYV